MTTPKVAKQKLSKADIAKKIKGYGILGTQAETSQLDMMVFFSNLANENGAWDGLANLEAADRAASLEAACKEAADFYKAGKGEMSDDSLAKVGQWFKSFASVAVHKRLVVLVDELNKFWKAATLGEKNKKRFFNVAKMAASRINANAAKKAEKQEVINLNHAFFLALCADKVQSDEANKNQTERAARLMLVKAWENFSATTLLTADQLATLKEIGKAANCTFPEPAKEETESEEDRERREFEEFKAWKASKAK